MSSRAHVSDLMKQYCNPGGTLVSSLTSSGSLTGLNLNTSPSYFRVMINVKHFNAKEIRIKIVKNYIVVHAKHEEIVDEHGFVSREFTRRYLIPEDVASDRINSDLSRDGILTVSAPKKEEMSSPSRERMVPINFQRTASFVSFKKDGMKAEIEKKKTKAVNLTIDPKAEPKMAKRKTNKRNRRMSFAPKKAGSVAEDSDDDEEEEEDDDDSNLSTPSNVEPEDESKKPKEEHFELKRKDEEITPQMEREEIKFRKEEMEKEKLKSQLKEIKSDIIKEDINLQIKEIKSAIDRKTMISETTKEVLIKLQVEKDKIDLEQELRALEQKLKEFK